MHSVDVPDPARIVEAAARSRDGSRRAPRSDEAAVGQLEAALVEEEDARVVLGRPSRPPPRSSAAPIDLVDGEHEPAAEDQARISVGTDRPRTAPSASAMLAIRTASSRDQGAATVEPDERLAEVDIRREERRELPPPSTPIASPATAASSEDRRRRAGRTSASATDPSDHASRAVPRVELAGDERAAPRQARDDREDRQDPEGPAGDPLQPVDHRARQQARVHERPSTWQRA